LNSGIAPVNRVFRGPWARAARQTVRASRMGAFSRGFFANVVLMIAAVMALVEAIFLAERFTIVFRDAAEKDANLFDIFLLLGCTSTEIFDLALAVAVLIAVYIVALRMRENRELLAFFAAGAGPFQVAGLALVLAFGAQLTSIAVSGFLDPASRYAQRAILLDAEFRALKTGISKGQFYFFPGYVAFAPEQQTDENALFAPSGSYLSTGHAVVPHKAVQKRENRRLFLYELAGPHTSRIVTADRAHLSNPDAAGRVTLTLTGFAQHMFNDIEAAVPAPQGAPACAGCPGMPEELPQVAMNVHEMKETMRIAQLLPFPPRGADPAEQTIPEQLRTAPSNTEDYYANMRLLGDRFTRSFLCLLAPLLALAALCLTSRRTSYLTLPLGCMVLMALNLFAEWLVRAIAPSGPLEALALPLILTVLLMGLLIAFVAMRQSALVRPGLTRA